MKVPFLDLKAQYQSISEEIDNALRQVVTATAFSGGPFVERFEEEFAAFCRSKFAIGVGSGTDALWLTLMALGVGQDDEVITVPNSFIATAEAVTQVLLRHSTKAFRRGATFPTATRTSSPVAQIPCS